MTDIPQRRGVIMKYKVGDIVRWKMCGKKGIVTKAEPLYRKHF